MSNHRSRSRSKSHERRQRHDRSNSPYRNDDRKQRHSTKVQKKKVQPKYQQTKTIVIETEDINISELQNKLSETSISIGTSLADQIEKRQGSTFIRYPSIQVASAIFENLQGSITINGKTHKLRYYPVRIIDVGMSYEWYCNKCDYKNYSKRTRCHRCGNQRNEKCRINYSSQQTPHLPQEKDDSANCSLMVRGPIIMEIEEEVLLNLFEKMAPIKDIRMIKNRIQGGYKDFAFVEFFTPEQTSFALNKATAPDFRVAGEKVTVLYSKTKNQDDFYQRAPYQARERRRGQKPPRRQRNDDSSGLNYYQRQRELEIEEEKKRPLVTLEQLKQKREQEMKKTQPQQQEMTEQQNKRKKAEMLARQWERQQKMQNNVLYICPLCRRKFKDEEEMNNHGKFSELHKYRLQQISLQTL